MGWTMPGSWSRASWCDVAVGFVIDALQDPDAVVLTHCHMGINRGPSLGYASLLALGWDSIEALDAIRTAPPIAAIGYAEDALAWHHDRVAASQHQRLADQGRLAQWRIDNDIDVETIIRKIRDTEPT